ncbi:MAG: hypothetical protein GC162_15555 [Planctomycetes bacterium]|nr:hypothetical protein [Planctomycetota bacterium]
MKYLIITVLIVAGLIAPRTFAEKLGESWGTAGREAEYYRIVDLPMPDELGIEAGAFAVLPDGRLAIGTRRGEIYLVTGAFASNERPTYHLYASGLDEIHGLDYRDGAFYIMQQTEVTRITDTDHDDRGDLFETLSDNWGFDAYHEFGFSSDLDAEGNIWITLCLSKSYQSDNLFRGWALKITPDGKTIPIASGIRSPGGVGPNEHGVMFYTESQGPWNGSCSLKVLEPGGFMGHPASFRWYPQAPNMGPVPVEPNTNSRLEIERKRVKQLVPYAVVFPYRRMGQSNTGYEVNHTGGKFGPFDDQIFIGDYTMSLLMRATTEKINGVWQGACYPFREGFATGLLAVQFTPNGQLIVGGTSRGWPVRGSKPFALQRVDWTGKVPFEILRISVRHDGFVITFTQPVDRKGASDVSTYRMATFTHIYQQAYGSPEVDQTTPTVTRAVMSDDGLSVHVTVEGMVKGHVHEFHMPDLKNASGQPLLHPDAYYTLNEIP